MLNIIIRETKWILRLLCTVFGFVLSIATLYLLETFPLISQLFCFYRFIFFCHPVQFGEQCAKCNHLCDSIIQNCRKINWARIETGVSTTPLLASSATNNWNLKRLFMIAHWTTSNKLKFKRKVRWPSWIESHLETDFLFFLFKFICNDINCVIA